MIHLYTIHGTWGNRGLLGRSALKWYTESSELLSLLKSKCGNLTVHPFEWDGLNSNYSRVVASNRFAEYYNQIHRAYPTDQHVVISHSHGGNVFIYSLASVHHENMPSMAIFMSTPFLSFQKAVHNKSDSTYINLWEAGLRSALLFILTLAAYYPLRWLGVSTECIFIASPLLIVLAMFANMFVLKRRALQIGKHIGRGKYIAKKLGRIKHIHVVNSNGDEAGMTLVTSGIISTANRIANDTVYRAFKRLADVMNFLSFKNPFGVLVVRMILFIVKVTFLVSVVMTLVTIVAVAFSELYFVVIMRNVAYVAFPILIFIALYMAISLAIGCIACVMLLLKAIFCLAFGLDSIALMQYYDLYVGPTPEGIVCNVYTTRPPRHMIAHFIYNRPEVQNYICDALCLLSQPAGQGDTELNTK